MEQHLRCVNLMQVLPLQADLLTTRETGTVLNAGANQAHFTRSHQRTSAITTRLLANRTITVNKATPLVTWPGPAQITYGTPLSSTQQNASANVPGTYTYTPPDGTILNTGANQNISVKFEPNDATNYNIVPTTSNADHGYQSNAGGNLGNAPFRSGRCCAVTATQLNATSNIPGTPTYAPGPGTVFNVEGTYTLHVSLPPQRPG